MPQPRDVAAATVLVVRRGGLGDTLLMLPVLAALRRGHPRARVQFAGVHEFAAVLQHYGAVDQASSSEVLQSWALGRDAAIAGAVRARLGEIAHVVADDPAFAALAGSARVQLFDPRPARDDVPLALQIGEQLSLEVDLADAALVRDRTVAAADSDAIALAPGSGAVDKCWPRAHWLEFAAALRSVHTPLQVVVGPAEQERDDPRRWSWPAAVEFLAGLSCTQLAARLVSARAFVGNDSGTTHLAAALRVPTIAIFGAGRPQVFAPPGATLVGGDGVAPPRASVAEVLRAVQRVLGAST